MNKSKITCLTLLTLLALLSSVPLKAQTPTPEAAIAFERQGNFADSEKTWRAIVQRDPKDAAALASLGLVLSKQGKYDQAAPVYGKALALSPNLPGIQLNLGLAEFKQGHFEPAISALTKALAADPKNVQVRALLGLSCYGAKRFADAAKHLELAAQSDPSNTELHGLLAQSCLWAKNYACALEEFRQVQQRDPDSAAAHMLSGEALDGLGRAPEAIAEFQAAAKSNPQEPNVHFGLGYLYWKQHQYDDAKTAFEGELAVDPAHAQSLAYLGDIAMKENDPERALPLLNKAIQSKSDLRLAYLDAGAILTAQKRYQEALAALQRAEKLDPTEPDAHYRLGRLYREMGNAAASQSEFAKVRELHEKADEDVNRKISDSPPALHP
jgi:tetratricopeptide (TPR) repeat protein